MTTKMTSINNRRKVWRWRCVWQQRNKLLKITTRLGHSGLMQGVAGCHCPCIADQPYAILSSTIYRTQVAGSAHCSWWGGVKIERTLQPVTPTWHTHGCEECWDTIGRSVRFMSSVKTQCSNTSCLGPFRHFFRHTWLGGSGTGRESVVLGCGAAAAARNWSVEDVSGVWSTCWAGCRRHVSQLLLLLSTQQLSDLRQQQAQHVDRLMNDDTTRQVK